MRKLTKDELRKTRSLYLTMLGLGFSKNEAKAAVSGLKTTFVPPIPWKDDRSPTDGE